MRSAVNLSDEINGGKNERHKVKLEIRHSREISNLRSHLKKGEKKKEVEKKMKIEWKEIKEKRN
jgi:hypothetical protein